jgi:hypothetical protein
MIDFPRTLHSVPKGDFKRNPPLNKPEICIVCKIRILRKLFCLLFLLSSTSYFENFKTLGVVHNHDFFNIFAFILFCLFDIRRVLDKKTVTKNKDLFILIFYELGLIINLIILILNKYLGTTAKSELKGFPNNLA